MSPPKEDVHELIAWGLDEYPYRSGAIGLRQEEFSKQIELTQQRLAERECYESCPAVLVEETENIKHLLTPAAQQTTFQQEYGKFEWKLGVVDLRCLLAFQRRLVFSSTRHHSPVPKQDDWPQLLSLALGSRRSTEHHFVSSTNAQGGLNISLYSCNPDLQLRLSPRAGLDEFSPFTLYGGSPFFEVAEFRGRWFLRDGYHRAYRLLQAGVHQMPAVILYARTMEELGATEPWFFHEDQLFSDRPPRVVDFIDESQVLRYERVALRKVIRVRVEGSLQPFDEIDPTQGEAI